jgi:hypothetical protein
VLLTRLPLTPKDAFDLHVLSLPPAFVLSQDQTLKFKEFNLDITIESTEPHPSQTVSSPTAMNSQNIVTSIISQTALKQSAKITAAYASLPLDQLVKEQNTTRQHQGTDDVTKPLRLRQARGLAPDGVRGTACGAQLEVGRHAVLARPTPWRQPVFVIWHLDPTGSRPFFRRF